MMENSSYPLGPFLHSQFTKGLYKALNLIIKMGVNHRLKFFDLQLLVMTSALSASSIVHSPLFFKQGLKTDKTAGHRAKGRAIQVLANPNVSSGKGKMKKEVIMVDPMEAKRLAVKQMEQIKAKENFKRKRRAEAINGALAVIGLTAGLVIEGNTGNNIVAQLTGYWAILTSFLDRFS